MRRSTHYALVVVFLLVGAWLRFGELATIDWALDYDEAYYGLNALSLLEQPRFTPFFPENNGRESLWMYMLLPALATLGAKTLAMRLTMVLVSMVTLAAAYRLARVLFNRDVALWTLAALSVVYWHAHLSHIAMRAVMYPLIGALAFAALFGAYRHNRWRDWLSTGVWFGLLGYTYLAARGWLALAVVVAGIWLIQGQGRRTGIVLAAFVALVIAAPLGLYITEHAEIANSRLTSEAIDLPSVLDNVFAWTGAWLYQGSNYQIHNAVNRPVLDVPLALMCLAGLIALVNRQRACRALFILLLGGVALAPSLLSNDAPHFLRAVGVVIPLALVLGLGAAQLAVWLPPRWRHYAALLPAGLLLMAGVHTRVDLATWAHTLRLPEVRQVRLERMQAMLAILDAPQTRLAGRAMYAEPDAEDRIVWEFLTYERDIPALNILEFPACTIGRPLPFDYVGAVPNEPAASARWGTVTSRWIDPVFNEIAWGYGIYAVDAPADRAVGELGNFGVALTQELPRILSSDATLPLNVRLTALAEIDQPYTLFVHLYPVDKVELVAQSDTPICPDFPPTRWYREQRAALVTTTVASSQPIPAGTYRVMLGIYASQSFTRLTTPDGADLLELGQITVE